MMRPGVLLNGEKAMFENTEKTLLFMRDSDDCGHRCYYDLSEIIKTLIRKSKKFWAHIPSQEMMCTVDM